jgi:hypothetical protein
MNLIMRTCPTHKTPDQQMHLIIMHHLHVKLHRQLVQNARSSRLIYPTKTMFSNNTKSTSNPLNMLLLIYQSMMNLIFVYNKNFRSTGITAY